MVSGQSSSNDVIMVSGQSRIQEVAELYLVSGHTWQHTTFWLKYWWPFLVTVLFSWPYDLCLVIICCIFAPLLVSPSHAASELTSAKIHVAERCTGKIRGGRVALRCIPPYFDHWSWQCCLVDLWLISATNICDVVLPYCSQLSKTATISKQYEWNNYY